MPLSVLARRRSASLGCGDDSAGNEDAVPVPGETTVGASADLAGTLHVTPTTVEPGEAIRIEVENRGDKTFSYPLHNRVERYVNGDWEAAVDPQPAPDILLSVRPGARQGPKYPDGPLADLVELPSDLESGTYRVVKDDGPGFTLEATFEIRSPSE